MLCLNLASGEYLTIGGSIVVQLTGMTGDNCKLMIQAPREIPIVRGEVLERGGAERPSCVLDSPRWHRKEIVWSRSKAQALGAMRKVLSQMDGRDSNVRALRRQLNHMFPPALSEDTEPDNLVSNG